MTPDIDAVAREVEAALSRDGLASPLRAEYVFNPGGFVNANFTVHGEGDPRHVKLCSEPGEFDRWYESRDLLRERYRAPEVLGRVTLPGSGLAGLVFPHLAGTAPSPEVAAGLLPEVVEVAVRLSRDGEMARRLSTGREVTIRSSYETGIFECLSEDLIDVKADPEVRAWIPSPDLAFLSEEVERLREMGSERLSAESCDTPCHGDLWMHNVLHEGEDWHLLDWDHLGIGDPAGDLATLVHSARLPGPEPFESLPDDPGLRERVETHLRAVNFDAIVDPLSDCTDMRASALADPDAVRREKRRIHTAALVEYREIYG